MKRWFRGLIAPHVSFDVTHDGTQDGAQKVAGALTDLLRSRFRFDGLMRTPTPAFWTAKFSVGDKAFVLMLTRIRSKQDRVALVVGPMSSRSLWQTLRGCRRINSTSELKLICGEIHHLLADRLGINGIVWYFQGPGHQSAAYKAPEDLPWDVVDDTPPTT
jgi:hypothetical protein